MESTQGQLPELGDTLRNSQQLSGFNAYMANMGLKLDAKQVEATLEEVPMSLILPNGSPAKLGDQLHTVRDDVLAARQ